MIDLILGNGFIAGLIAALVAVIGAWWHGRKSGETKARAKEADAYERHLEDIARAHDARNRIDPDSLPDDDPYRRE